MIGKDYLVPVLLPFPIWRYGARYNIFGKYVDDGWRPDRYGKRRFPTRDAALEWAAQWR